MLSVGGRYTRAVDWWAFGCVCFELMSGRTPFCRDHNEDSHHAIYLRVIKGTISFPSFIKATPRALVKHLLKADFHQRLTTSQAIKAHPFFEEVDWRAVEQKRAKPPHAPLQLAPGDAGCFDEYHPRHDPDENFNASRCDFSGF